MLHLPAAGREPSAPLNYRSRRASTKICRLTCRKVWIVHNRRQLGQRRANRIRQQCAASYQCKGGSSNRDVTALTEAATPLYSSHHNVTRVRTATGSAVDIARTLVCRMKACAFGTASLLAVGSIRWWAPLCSRRLDGKFACWSETPGWGTPSAPPR